MVSLRQSTASDCLARMKPALNAVWSSMFFAFCTLVCWTVAGFSSAQAARIAGSLRANLWRLLIASVPMLFLGPLFVSDPLLLGVTWFALGGVLHLGLGDIGLFGAYRRLGPRLGFLTCGCSIPVMAGIIEWLWLGVVPSARTSCLAVVVLAGVVFALAPTEKIRIEPGAWWPGITAGLLGLGAGPWAPWRRARAMKLIPMPVPWSRPSGVSSAAPYPIADCSCPAPASESAPR